ncbi:hypothetical protein LSI54_09085 [Nesterenkonia sp. AY15]|uniref:hypothetical protein n=1 Tax=Nesterenkonia sp. AY15 TaxID=2901139 RepID=UPI001F4D1D6E|nr:hypothetical protein [Nesterenkonia sp. AY15]MCH8571504.1 hypothetical protein [Nesterenkonia sp. AY15]
MNGIDFYCDGSPGEVRSYQAGYLAGVHEGVKLGREELIAEQLEAQRKYAEAHDFARLMDAAVVGMRVRKARAQSKGVAA